MTKPHFMKFVQQIYKDPELKKKNWKKTGFIVGMIGSFGYMTINIFEHIIKPDRIVEEARQLIDLEIAKESSEGAKSVPK